MQQEQIKEFFEGVKEVNKLSERDLDNFFSNLRFRLDIFQEYKKQTDVYLASDFNVFEYIQPNENRLSDIIADLLNPDGKHGQGDLFLNEFLRMIDASRQYEAQKVNVKREDPTRYIMNPFRRIDIIIDFDSGDFGIGVENKPWAGEQQDQIRNYKEHLEKKYKSFILVYLSGDGSEPQSIGKDEREALKQNGRLKVLTYFDDVKNWLESCYKECKAEKVRWFLTDFIEYIGGNFKQSLEGGEEDDE